ncbi:polysaccharide biosynthesis/export family protein [Alsobacter sp. R-9]
MIALHFDRAIRPLRLMILGFVAVAGLQLTACAPDPYLTNAAETPSKAVPDIRITPGDKIRVTVFNEPNLSGEFDVDVTGNVSLPVAGTLKIAGMTRPQVEGILARRLKSEYLRDPKVTVDISNYRPFYILGEVKSPGAYPYKDKLNIMSAIATAGGETYRASRSAVYIQRGGTGPFFEYQLSPSVPVMPGDVVRLPERYF